MPTRLCPARPLPPYSYVPGKFPHPLSDQRGHSFGHREPPISLPTDDNWPHCEPYLWGFDLFNHGYYWEAHEIWEGVWNACGRTGRLANLLKGLIKLAAAGVKAREGSADGVRRHLLRGAELLDSVGQAIAPGTILMGIDPSALAQVARELQEKREVLANPSGDPVVIVMPIVLYPEVRMASGQPGEPATSDLRHPFC